MKTNPIGPDQFPTSFGKTTAQRERSISLQLLVNQLLSGSMAKAFHSKTLVINQVARNIELPRNKAMIAPVIRELLATVIENASCGQIYISAERFRDIIILQIQERNNNNGYALGYSVRAMESEVTHAGGNIAITGEQQRVVTISLSFPCYSESTRFDC